MAGAGAGGIGSFAVATSTIRRVTVVPGTSSVEGIVGGDVIGVGVADDTDGGIVGRVGNDNANVVDVFS